MGPSKSPTKAEREWMDRVREFGCVACHIDGLFRPAVIHHIVQANKRLGHLFTIGLCEPGHHQDGQSVGMVSVHPWKARFEAQYGTQLELLALLKQKLGVFERAEYSA
jgi:hypothetical protein